MKRAVMLTLLLGTAVSTLVSQIPHTLSYQGVLTDNSGTPAPDGTVGLTFRLFDVAGGGTPLWEEAQQVLVQKGVFNAILGSVTPLNLPFDKPYWLGITIGQGTELAPRTPLTSSPYALSSRSTMAEPAPGQGLTIRDSSGTPTHTFLSNGDAIHTGKTKIQLLHGSGSDTALVIAGTGGSALVVVQPDSVMFGQAAGNVRAEPQRKPGKGMTRSKSASPLPIYAVRGVSPLGIGVGGLSRRGDGVSGQSETGNGVSGYSFNGPGIYGESVSSAGVWGYAPDEVGVYGESNIEAGVEGQSDSGPGVYAQSGFGPGVYAVGIPAGVFDGHVVITRVDPDLTQERVLVWSDDNFVRYKVLPTAGSFNGVLQGKALVVKNAAGTEVFRVDTTGASLHKGDETFEGDVILKGQDGKGAKLVDANGATIAGFGRLDLDNGQRIGVYGKAEKTGDLAGAFQGDVEVNGEVFVSSLHVVRGAGDTVVHFNADGTSEHWGLETYRAGLRTVLNNGNILRFDPAEGLTLKTAGGQFRGHMDPNGNGLFAGNLGVAGTLSKASGSFKIDHPLDPANKYLYHSFVESPDMKNIYDGVAVLDAEGTATVPLPAWFEALNRDFRYQLTAIGTPAPNLHISSRVSGNQFTIAGGVPGIEVSWQVTGIRKDAYAEKHRIPVEEPKPVAERGRFLHPDAFGRPDEEGIPLAQRGVVK